MISHPHIDHFGLLAHVSDRVKVGIGKFAKHIIEASAPFLLDSKCIMLNGWELISEQDIKIGPFLITPYLVDHSAYDSYALKIESRGVSIFYSGDFRAHGRKAGLFDRLIARPPQNINTLLIEGSSFGRVSGSENFPTEIEIEHQLADLFAQTHGLSLVHTSGQNIDRIVSIFKAAKRTGRKLIIDLYVAEVLRATGNAHIPQSSWKDIVLYVPHAQRILIKRKRLFNILDNHAVNRIFIEDIARGRKHFTLLFRPIHCTDLESGRCLEDASYIYSLWDGYWNQGGYGGIKEWLERNSLIKYSVHTSGHASLSDLKIFVSALNPKVVVPIHTFSPEKYADLFPRTKIHHDGEWWEVK